MIPRIINRQETLRDYTIPMYITDLINSLIVSNTSLAFPTEIKLKRKKEKKIAEVKDENLSRLALF